MSEDAALLRGLPERLPPGERVLWQGHPRWTALARRALHTRKITLYFVVLALWGVVSDLADGASWGAAALTGLWTLPVAVVALGLPALLAWLIARTTVYAITSRRVILRFGVALPMTVNIPFRIIGSAGLRRYPDGTGDITLALTGTDRMAFLHLWPHARPWRVARPEPMLRTIPDAARVAEILTEALGATTAAPIEAPADIGERAGAPDASAQAMSSAA